MNQYMDEVKTRWGNTEAFRQSQERVGPPTHKASASQGMSKEDMERIKADGVALMKELASRIGEDAGNEPVQRLIARHYENLRHFYEPSPALYKGLAEMYVADPRFTAYFEKYGKGLAQFIHDGMLIFVDEPGPLR